MKHSARPSVIVLAVLLSAGTLAASASGAAGQDAPEEEHWHPRWGDWALSFDLPSGGGSGLGFWRLAGARHALGFTVGGTVSYFERDEAGASMDGTQISITAGPALKRYWWQEGPVAPFFRAGARGIYQRNAVGEAASWRMGGTVDLGIGAEWFPTRGIGIGGHTGVEGAFFWATDNSELTGDNVFIRGDLFTSALTVQIYF